MRQYVNFTVAERIKLFMWCLILLLLLTGDTNLRKKILWEEFEWAFMRQLPSSTAVFERVQEFVGALGHRGSGTHARAAVHERIGDDGERGNTGEHERSKLQWFHDRPPGETANPRLGICDLQFVICDWVFAIAAAIYAEAPGKSIGILPSRAASLIVALRNCNSNFICRAEVARTLVCASARYFNDRTGPQSGNSAAVGILRWSRLSEQIFRVDKWSVCRG